MTMARLTRIAELKTARRILRSVPLLTLDQVESGTGRRLSQSMDVELPSEVGVADALPGDVLFGKLRPYLAKVLHVTAPCVASTELMCLRPREGVLSRWLFYTLLSRRSIEWAVATSDGAKMPRTSWERLGQLPVSVPSPTQQAAITDYLDAETTRIDDLIEKKQGMVRLLEERFWLGFMARVRNFEASGMQLRRAFSFITDGPFGSAFSSSDYADSGAAVVRLGNIGFAEYRPDDQARIPIDLYQRFLRHRVSAGDLLLAGLGDERNHAGRACVAPAELAPALVKGKCFCARVRNDVADPHFLALFLSSPMGAAAMEEVARGSTRMMINLDIVKAARIPHMRLDVQRAIAAQTEKSRDSTRHATEVLSRQISLLLERRQALITAAVTGQLDIPGAAA
jgi:type I restriction enzyme S subunit